MKTSKESLKLKVYRNVGTIQVLLEEKIMWVIIVERQQ